MDLLVQIDGYSVKNQRLGIAGAILLACLFAALYPFDATAETPAEGVEAPCAKGLVACVAQKRAEFQNRGALGMMIHEITPEADQKLQGYWLVHKVLPSGAAAGAGLHEGDVILAWDDIDSRALDSLRLHRMLEKVLAKQNIALEISRDQVRKSVELEAGAPGPEHIAAWLYAYVALNFSEDDLKRFEAEGETWGI